MHIFLAINYLVFRLFSINNMQLLKLYGTVVKKDEKLIADLFIRAFSNKGI
jgi:hypothetical protein